MHADQREQKKANSARHSGGIDNGKSKGESLGQAKSLKLKAESSFLPLNVRTIGKLEEEWISKVHKAISIQLTGWTMKSAFRQSENLFIK